MSKNGGQLSAAASAEQLPAPQDRNLYSHTKVTEKSSARSGISGRFRIRFRSYGIRNLTEMILPVEISSTAIENSLVEIFFNYCARGVSPLNHEGSGIHPDAGG
jgi:hypothetical protein